MESVTRPSPRKKKLTAPAIFGLTVAVTLAVTCAAVCCAPWLILGYTRVGAEEYNRVRLQSTQPLGLHLIILDGENTYGDLSISGETQWICISSLEEKRADRILTREELAKVELIEQAFRAGWDHARTAGMGRGQDPAHTGEEMALWRRCWNRGVEAFESQK